MQLQRNYGIDSHIIVLSFINNEDGEKAITQLSRIRRGLDITWQLEVGNRLMLANLMPLANDPAVEGYLLRIETMLKEHMGIEHDNWNLTPIEISLSESDPIASLKRAIRGLEV